MSAVSTPPSLLLHLRTCMSKLLPPPPVAPLQCRVILPLTPGQQAPHKSPALSSTWPSSCSLPIQPREGGGWVGRRGQSLPESPSPSPQQLCVTDVGGLCQCQLSFRIEPAGQKPGQSLCFAPRAFGPRLVVLLAPARPWQTDATLM